MILIKRKTKKFNRFAFNNFLDKGKKFEGKLNLVRRFKVRTGRLL